MDRNVGLFLVSLLANFVAVGSAASEPYPQQGWYVERVWTIPAANVEHIGVDRDGNVYTHWSSDPIGVRIFDPNGNWLNQTSPRAVPTLVSAEGFAVDPTGDPLTDRILIFSGYTSNEAAVESCLAVPFDAGVNEDACTSASGPVVSVVPGEAGGGYRDVDVGLDGSVYSSSFDSTVRIFDLDLNPGASFGQSGVSGAPGTLIAITAIAVSNDGTIWVQESSNRRVHQFSPSGDFLGRFGVGGNGDALEASFGEVWSNIQSDPGTGNSYEAIARVYTLSGTFKQTARAPNFAGFTRANDFAFDGPDLVYVAGLINGEVGVAKYRRAYRTYDVSPADVPVPEVLSLGSLPGTSTFKVDYTVHDPDSATVEVRAIAFQDGVLSLNNVLEITTVSGPLGMGVASNTQHQLLWDAGTDLSGLADFIDASVRVMSKDERTSILNLHFITIPGSICMDENLGGDLMINVSPVSEGEMLDAWLWLIAGGDSGIAFANGEVRDSGNNDLLASGTSTTPEGRAFLFSRLMAREATSTEVSCAAEATTPGLVNQFVPQNKFGGRPIWVNEFGFDTGSSGFWLVATP